MRYIENLTNDNGRHIANQFIIINEKEKTITYQSYTAIIAIITNGKLVVDPHYWRYKRGTRKYFNKFLASHNFYNLSEKTPKEQEKYFYKNDMFQLLNYHNLRA